MGGLPPLKRAGYNPTEFYRMVERHGGVAPTAHRLLADPRHTSYGFQRLYEMDRLDASVEYAVCLPWFSELYTPEEQDEARTWLLLHESRCCADSNEPSAIHPAGRPAEDCPQPYCGRCLGGSPKFMTLSAPKPARLLPPCRADFVVGAKRL